MDVEISISINEFRKASQIVSKSQALVEKALWLVRTYECFRSDKPPPHKQYKQQHSVTLTACTRKTIIAKDLSTEAITHRHMTTLMNKLSPTNKEHIISQVRSAFREDHARIVVDIVWEFMLISPEHQDLYTDVLVMLTPHVSPYIQDLCQKWLVSTDQWDFNGDVTTSEDYDDFCDNVKRKRRAVATIRGFGSLLRKKLIRADTYKNIVAALYDACNNHLKTPSPRCFEVVVDQFKAAAPAVTSYFDISKWIELAPSLPPSARFKIYDIRDKNL